jgi:hypothetical protein
MRLNMNAIIKTGLMLLFIGIVVSCSNHVEKQLDLSNATILISSAIKSPVNETAGDILTEEIDKRTRLKFKLSNNWDNNTIIALALTSDTNLYGESIPSREGDDLFELKKEGYRIFHENKNGKDILWIIGADARGVLYGIGKFLRTFDFTKGKLFINAKFDISSSPEYEIRGLQFSKGIGTNPLANQWDIKQYETSMRDHVLFGMNAFESGLDEHMTKKSELCAKYDVDFCLFTSAPHLSFEEAGKKKVRTLKAIKALEEQIQTLTRLDVVGVPGGDTGSNKPQDLIPYVKDLATMVHKKFPKAEIWFSTQEFTDDGMQYTVDYLNENKPGWLTGVVYGPHTLWSVKKHREKIPKQFKIRLYSDICHSFLCQYPVENWDQTFAITFGRQGTNPRPVAYTKIARNTLPYSDGVLPHTTGVTDDVNKSIWLQLAWDSNIDVKKMMENYAKFYFKLDEINNKKIAQGVLGIEKNWDGPIGTNKEIDNTFKLWQELEKANPQLGSNWRWQQLLIRVYYDMYNKKKFLYEKRLEEKANKILANAAKTGSYKAMEEALLVLDKAEKEPVNQDYRAKALNYAEILFKSIGERASLEHGASIGRGAIIDFIDMPLNNRRWLEDQIAEAKNLKSEKSRRSKLKFIATYSDQKEGVMYDNIAGLTSKHDITEPTTALKYLADSELFNRKRLSALLVHPTFETKLRYTGLDPKSDYLIRLSGKGKTFLKANNVRLKQLYSTELEIVPETMFVQKDGVTPGLDAYYWNNKKLEGPAVAHQIDNAIDHFWDYGESPLQGVVNDNGFSVRWIGKLKSPGTGLYGISVEADNGVKLYLNGKVVFDGWENVPGASENVFYEFKEGEVYDLKVEFYENVGYCKVLFRMSKNPVKDMSKFENYGKEYGQYKEFLIPKELLIDGNLNISFDPIKGEKPRKVIGIKMLSRVSDVWLIKQNKVEKGR